MGGSSKPAPPKVTPFVEPPAPRNPVPNWFQRSGRPVARYTLPAAPVRGAFGAQGQPVSMQPQQAAPEPQIDPQLAEIVRRIMAGSGGLM